MASKAITLEEARSLLTADGQSREVTGFLSRAGRQYQSETDKSEEARGHAVYIAAVSTHVATTTGALLPEGTRPGGDTVGMSVKDYAALYGVSPTNVPHWRTLGHMAVVVGVPLVHSPRGTDKSTWQLASQTPGEVLKSAVYADGATEESIREALLTVRHPDGKRIASPQQGGKGKARNVGGTDGKSVSDLIAEDPIGAAVTFADALAAACKAIPVEDREGWSKVESKITEILTRENTLRSKAAASKRTASKRTASKRTARKAS